MKLCAKDSLCFDSQRYMTSTKIFNKDLHTTHAEGRGGSEVCGEGEVGEGARVSGEDGNFEARMRQ